jgi:hypothetical protein
VEFADSIAGQPGFVPEPVYQHVPKRYEFFADVWPILQEKCVSCHSGPEAPNGFVIDENLRDTPQVAVWRSLVSELARRIKDDDMPREGEPLTSAQKRAIYIWMDSGAAKETGGHFTRDTNRPTGHLETDAPIFGAKDVEGGPVTHVLTVNGQEVPTQQVTPYTYSYPLPLESNGIVTLTVTDQAGNSTTITRLVRVGEQPPPPPDPVDEVERLKAEIAELRRRIQAAIQHLQGPD